MKNPNSLWCLSGQDFLRLGGAGRFVTGIQFLTSVFLNPGSALIKASVTVDPVFSTTQQISSLCVTFQKNSSYNISTI